MFYINLLLVLLSFFAMEGVAWLTHKYVMHGLLWALHKDHHKKDHALPMERNDFFFVLFALPGILFLYTGLTDGFDWKFWIGAGITMYGAAYFVVHDLFIHQRLKIFRNSGSSYLRGLRRAHKMHHKHTGRENGECFGMLLVPFRYWRGDRNRK